MNTRRSTAGAVVVRYHLEPTKVQIFLRCSDQKLDVRRKRNDFEKIKIFAIFQLLKISIKIPNVDFRIFEDFEKIFAKHTLSFMRKSPILIFKNHSYLKISSIWLLFGENLKNFNQPENSRLRFKNFKTRYFFRLKIAIFWSELTSLFAHYLMIRAGIHVLKPIGSGASGFVLVRFCRKLRNPGLARTRANTILAVR